MGAARPTAVSDRAGKLPHRVINGECWCPAVVSTHNRAKETTIRAPGVDGFAISMIERGAGGLILPGSYEPVIGNAKTGLIYSVEPGTRLTASDLQSRLYLRLPTAFLCRKLEAMLDGQQVDSIAFQPMFDQTRG